MSLYNNSSATRYTMEPPQQRVRLHRNPRDELPNNLQAQHLPIKEILAMFHQVHVWTTDLRNYTQNHNAAEHNRDYNRVIVAKADATTELHGRACDLAVRTPYLFAHGILEINYDTALITWLAHTNKAM